MQETCLNITEAITPLHEKSFALASETVALQHRLFGREFYVVPDFMFPHGTKVRVPTHPGDLENKETQEIEIFWIESQAVSYLTTSLTHEPIMQKLKRRLEKYASQFGPGLVLWPGGFCGNWYDRHDKKPKTNADADGADADGAVDTEDKHSNIYHASYVV